MFKILHQWVPPSSLLSVFEIINGYFLPGIFFWNIMNSVVLSEGKYAKKVFIDVFIIYFFKCFFDLKIANTP